MRNAKSLQIKAKSHQAIPLDHNTFKVVSGTSGSSYNVRLIPNIDGAECDCDWGKYRKGINFYRSGCSHVQAVYRHIENLAVRETSTWASEDEARRQRRPTVNIGDGIWMTSRSTF